MQLLAFTNKNVCPPDGFRYVYPVDGFVAHAWTHDAWIALMRAHLQANQILEPIDLIAQMEHQMCLNLDPGWCAYDQPDRPRVSTSLTWDDVRNGLVTFGHWIAGGLQYVTQKEADRRALICSRCYLNVHVSGCAACHEAVKQVVSSRHSKYDSSLKACAACKCLLQAKVHFPISVLDREPDSVQAVRPDFCWLKRHGENYIAVPG